MNKERRALCFARALFSSSHPSLSLPGSDDDDDEGATEHTASLSLQRTTGVAHWTDQIGESRSGARDLSKRGRTVPRDPKIRQSRRGNISISYAVDCVCSQLYLCACSTSLSLFRSSSHYSLSFSFSFSLFSFSFRVLVPYGAGRGCLISAPFRYLMSALLVTLLLRYRCTAHTNTGRPPDCECTGHGWPTPGWRTLYGRPGHYPSTTSSTSSYSFLLFIQSRCCSFRCLLLLSPKNHSTKPTHQTIQ